MQWKTGISFGRWKLILLVFTTTTLVNEKSFKTAVFGKVIKTQQELLLDHLFKDRPFLPEILPRKDWNTKEPLKIYIDTIVYNVEKIDASQEELALDLWISLVWKADILSWNATEFGIRQLFVPANRVWTPQLLIPSSSGNPIFGPTPNMSVLLNHDGTCSLNFVASRNMECEMKACLFPSDDHKCPLMVILYNYNISKAILVPRYESNLRAVLLTNGTPTWSLSLSKGTSGNFTMPNLPEFLFTRVQYDLTIRRKARYYLIIVLCPVLFIVIASFCSTLLPPDSGDRLSLLVTSLLSLVVYLDVAFRYLPESSQYTPAIAAWLLMVMAFLTIQVILSCLAARYSEKAENSKRMTHLEKILIVYILGTVVCTRFVAMAKKSSKKAKENKAQASRALYISKNPHIIVTPDTPEENHVEQNNTLPDEEAKGHLHRTIQKLSEKCGDKKKRRAQDAKQALAAVDMLSWIITISMFGLSIAFFYIVYNQRSFTKLCNAF